MPSEKVLEQKQQVVSAIRERVENAAAGVIVDYKGISVADDTKLRKDLRAAGVEYSVVKNTLLKIAVKDSGLEGLSSVLDGTSALATSRRTCPPPPVSCLNTQRIPKASSASKPAL